MSPEDQALTLYVDGFWISPYAMSSFVALEEKELPYTVREVPLDKQAQHDDAFRARTSRVPALRHGDFWLAESQAIAEYLAETFPTPKHPRLFPADLRERAVCREVMSWVRSDLMPIRDERATHTVFYEKARTPLSGAGQRAAEKLVRAASSLVHEGRTTLFASWCIADVDLGMMLMRLRASGDPLPKKLEAYADAQWARPSVRKWVEHPRPPYVAY
jgi:glutathione S-transferase